jgi:predicted metal-dependent hydrolase
MSQDRPGYSIRRSDRARHARLTVTPEGEALVVLPRRAPLRTAALLVEQHADWLRRHVARARAEQARLAVRAPLEAGRVLMVNGIPHQVVVHADGAADRAASVARTGVSRRLVPSGDGIAAELHVRTGADGDGVASGLEAWLRAEARRIITARVAALAGPIGVRPGPLTIRGQRSRWGSASRSGALSFNWRLVLAPPFVLDAVVVHELAHLRIPGHSPAFWAFVRKHAPRTQESRRWLRSHHRELIAALDG